MLSHLDKFRIILGSQSPRRQELLKGLNIDFEVKTIDVEETYPHGLSGAEIPCYLAEKKANAHPLDDNTLLITADTIVWLDGEVLGKPANKEEAISMLSSLSGKMHEVITGVCITTKKRRKTFSVMSEVTFAKLTEDEISYYVENYRPYDKAGAYGVQEWIGYVGVEHIEGSYYNIMGLPVQRFYTELKNWHG
ncbi:septum formation protein Maf [Paludibacter sp. 221]|uniref:Maf-like protein n=1 Tax=Paludibacter sp. 221 TaxID=2302939 RepID=UPI0013D84E96|nr:Maf-like protein [Paludibacter sp. 221]NDV46966.1 septum formation protein Maf [Paludibacter sp. 221]